MELTKKTTILFPPEMYENLVRLARQRGVSLGHLVRTACEEKYYLVSSDERILAVEDLERMALPVDDVIRMKIESVPRAEELIP